MLSIIINGLSYDTSALPTDTGIKTYTAKVKTKTGYRDDAERLVSFWLRDNTTLILTKYETIQASEGWLISKGLTLDSPNAKTRWELTLSEVLAMYFSDTSVWQNMTRLEYCPVLHYVYQTWSKMRPQNAIVKFLCLTNNVKENTLGDLKTRLGNYLDSIKLESNDYNLVLTSGCQGTASEYCHSVSCWWNGYSNSRNFLTGNSGGAILTVRDIGNRKSSNVTGRIWYIPAPLDLNALIVFNNYGGISPHSLHKWATVVKEFFKFTHETPMSAPEYRGDNVYFNNGMYVLHNGLSQSQLDSIYEYDYEQHNLDEYENTLESCCLCGDSYDSDNEGYHDDNGRFYCDDCYSEHFFTCEKCYETYSNGDMCEFNGQCYCDHCMNEIASYCDTCDSYHLRDDMVSPDLCNSCAESMSVCSVCDRYVDNDAMHNDDKCKNCHNEVVQQTYQKVFYRSESFLNSWGYTSTRWRHRSNIVCKYGRKNKRAKTTDKKSVRLVSPTNHRLAQWYRRCLPVWR